MDACSKQIQDVITQYGRMVTRLRIAGKLPRNPKENEEVDYIKTTNAVMFSEAF